MITTNVDDRLTRSLPIICVGVLLFDPENNSEASWRPALVSPHGRGLTSVVHLGAADRLPMSNGHTYSSKNMNNLRLDHSKLCKGAYF